MNQGRAPSAPAVMLSMLACTLLLVLSASCASGPPGQQALDRASSLVSSAADRGDVAIDKLDTIRIRSRYNPCRCPAPDFEAHFRGHWQRVLLEGDDELLEQLQFDVEMHEERGELAVVVLEGEFTGPARFHQTAMEYERFYVVDFQVEPYDE